MKKTVCCACCVLLLCGLLAVPADSRDAAEVPARPFLVLELENKIIGPVTADYIVEGIAKARDGSYQGVLIEMDTPGGLLESTRRIVKAVLNAPVPVVVYVAPGGSRAGSAGVFIALAAHVAAMAPSTNIGAAHPVMMGDGQKGETPLKKAIEDLTDALRDKKEAAPKERTPEKKKKETTEEEKPREGAGESANPMQDKILNDTLAWVATIAKSRGRNAEWARKAVRESASATEKEALSLGVIDIVAADRNDLLQKMDGLTVTVLERPITLHTKGARLVALPMTKRQDILSTVIHPNIAYIFMLLGMIGLFIEITHPGSVFPGVAGVICLIVAFYAFAVLPINYAGVLLIALAVILFIAEALTPATFGLLTLGGAVSMVLGSLMLIDSPLLGLKVSLSVVLPFVVAVAGIVLFLVSRVVKAHRTRTQTGPEALIGETGTARTDIAPEGQAFVNGELWTALSQDGKNIQKGEKIKVVGIDKIKLIVSK